MTLVTIPTGEVAHLMKVIDEGRYVIVGFRYGGVPVERVLSSDAVKLYSRRPGGVIGNAPTRECRRVQAA